MMRKRKENYDSVPNDSVFALRVRIMTPLQPPKSLHAPAPVDNIAAL